MKTLYYEDVLETFAGTVIKSKVRLATKEDIQNSENLHKQGKCDHKIFYDEYYWLYDVRTCAICGTGLGTV
jgi:hypothetical protein